jgi:UDP-GlcNAc:undecaprenyl-phosphate GlcNAc-1-phosphate transferase
MSAISLISLGLFLTAWALTALITPVCIKLGKRWNIIDNPGERKVHSKPVPRVGGLAIFVTIGVLVVLGSLLLPTMRNAFVKDTNFYVSVSIAASMVFAVGLYDDARGAGITIRLVVETAAALIVMFGGGILIERFTVPFVGPMELGGLSMPLTVLWIVGVTNAFNIIDGLDGLAGGVAFIACFAVFAVALMNGQPMAMASMALLAGACLGFLRYNSHPARVFLGDSGSLLLGFLLAVISIDTSLKRSTGLALLIPMQMLAVPLLDTLYSMARRFVAEVKDKDRLSLGHLSAMFRSDRQHIHHTLLDVGFSHPTAVWILYGLSILLGGFGLLSAITLDDKITVLLVMGGFIGFLVVRHWGASLPVIRRWNNADPEPKDGSVDDDASD